ncbi:signal peptidase 22kDa subunit [Syncephalis plumigaleata]|nr:signal peptidase 22kDa subunit [Syncephalis plumigaleata]
MYSLLQRLGAVTATATTGWLSLPHLAPTASIAVNNIQVFHGSYDPYYSDGGDARDHVFTEIDLDADLTPLFSWNTKQLYVNLVAEYDSKSHAITVWDTLVLSVEEAKLKLRRQTQKYSFTDIRRSFGR